MKFDVGAASGPWGSTYFVEGLGMGLFTDTMSRLDARKNIDIAHHNVAEKKITVAQGEEAKSHPVKLAEMQRSDELAPYFVEELRRYLEKTYGTSAVHEGGLRVFSTLNVEMQKAANTALRAGMRVYDKRHGWRGSACRSSR